jgi:hypothetical protein
VPRRTGTTLKKIPSFWHKRMMASKRGHQQIKTSTYPTKINSVAAYSLEKI